MVPKAPGCFWLECKKPKLTLRFSVPVGSPLLLFSVSLPAFSAGDSPGPTKGLETAKPEPNDYLTY